jgi:hypothetical protein
MFRLAAGKKALIATRPQMDDATKTHKKLEDNKRSVSVTWCDFLAERQVWRETFKEVGASKFVAPSMRVFEQAIEEGSGFKHGEYFIKSILWFATEYQDGNTWKPISGPNDPGGGFSVGGHLTDEADIKAHIGYKDCWALELKFPDKKPGYPGAKIAKDGSGNFVDKGKKIRLSIVIDGIGCVTQFNGYAWKGKIWMNTFGGVKKDPVGMGVVIAHELGHNMGQGYGDKTLDAARGRKEGIPGIPFPPVVPAGNKYTEHGHRGIHCANGLADKTRAHYDVPRGVSLEEHTCIMYGAMDMNSSKEYPYCEECTPFIRGEVLTDIRKAWEG